VIAGPSTNSAAIIDRIEALTGGPDGTDQLELGGTSGAIGSVGKAVPRARFTLIEVMVVIVILGVLAALVVRGS
jgi:prepilin-type N-terminal cleavage/methylation domain-containing protein